MPLQHRREKQPDRPSEDSYRLVPNLFGRQNICNTGYPELRKDVNAQADVFQHEIVNSGFSGLNPLYWVDFKLRYTKASVGMTDNSLGEKSTEQEFNTNFYPVRLVEDSYLENALEDFILKSECKSKDEQKIFDLLTKHNISFIYLIAYTLCVI